MTKPKSNNRFNILPTPYILNNKKATKHSDTNTPRLEFVKISADIKNKNKNKFKKKRKMKKPLGSVK